VKLWFAIPLGAAMLLNVTIAEWFVSCCVVLAAIFGPLAAIKTLRRQS
jgi:hypothetical protein